MPRREVVVLVGPTAVGKTALSLKLAKRLDAEMISADSMQVYKGMRLLSQAPGRDQMRGVKHHLVGILDPAKEYSASDFRNRATRLIRDIISRGKTPLVVGGSGLYVRALVDGLFPSPGKDARFRKKMYDYKGRYGSERLYQRLLKLDAESARRIHPNDTKRIIRALEIYHATGSRMSELKSMTRGLKDEHDIEIFGLTRPRDELYNRINDRVERMFGSGLIAEVKRLSESRLSRTARSALGFKEVKAYIKGEVALDAAKELLKKKTRRFAKRQIAWFRPDARIRWFDASKASEEKICKAILRELRCTNDERRTIPPIALTGSAGPRPARSPRLRREASAPGGANDET